MPPLPVTFGDDVISRPARAQFEAFIDEHRGALNRRLDEASWVVMTEVGGLLLATYTVTLGALGTRITMRRDLT